MYLNVQISEKSKINCSKRQRYLNKKQKQKQKQNKNKNKNKKPNKQNLFTMIRVKKYSTLKVCRFLLFWIIFLEIFFYE